MGWSMDEHLPVLMGRWMLQSLGSALEKQTVVHFRCPLVIQLHQNIPYHRYNSGYSKDSQFPDNRR